MTGRVTFEDGRTRFNEVASRPAFISRSEAISLGTQAVAGMSDEAEDWLSNDVESLRGLIAGLAASAGAPELDPVYRTICSIRDIAGHFGRANLSMVADGCCELVSRMIRADSSHKGALQTYMSAFDLLLGQDGSDLSVAEMDRLALALQELLKLYPDPDATVAGE